MLYLSCYDLFKLLFTLIRETVNLLGTQIPKKVPMETREPTWEQ